MPTDVVMPQMGESIFEGTITKWLKKPGDKVRRDEPLFEVSTDKGDAEIPAPASGALREIKVAEGATVQVNTVVGVIGDGAVAAKPAPAPAAAAPAAPKLKSSFEQRYSVRLTFMPFFVRAALIALQQYPIVNASVEADSIHYHKHVNAGIAVALDWGLIVPVLKNADEPGAPGLALFETWDSTPFQKHCPPL